MAELGLKRGIEGKTFVIQGLGNVGYHAALYMIEAGARLVGVAEIDGSIYSKDGIDLQKLMQYKQETGGVTGFEGTETLGDSSSVLESECDILIPAALENQINDENADKIKAKIIGEAANGPTTAKARSTHYSG